MSEMTSVETQQQQQQQYVGSSSNTEHHCKDCGVNFESEKSLEVHVRYHQENLLNQWTKPQQEESNNNHSKTGNHNNVSRDNVTVPTDSSDPSSMSPSQDPASSQQQQQQQLQQQPPQQQQQQTPQQQQQQTPQQQQQQPTIHAIACPSYDPFQASMFTEPSYFIQNDQSYILPHHFSPSQEEAQSNGGNGNYGSRYHPYPPYSTDRVAIGGSNSTSPQNPPFQCDKCGVVYEDANQLGEHMRTNHLDSPSAYPSATQYQQLGNSPQQGQQLHPSPPLSNQPQQQPAYDYNGGQTVKPEVKQEPEEQAEILDLDSHKVQTHRYEEELMRLQQQQQHQQQHQQQGLQLHPGIQIHQQVMQQQQQQQQQQQRIGQHSIISWPPPTAPTHDYHPVMPVMGAIESVPPMTDQGQFMRGQHMPVEHGHQGSPIMASTQSMPSHQMPAGFVQQPPKAPTIANQSWKSNEPRRPKTYNCSACNKWFTSSGHLKRHYNTTLHKNAVKNGKEPDPATQPISNHHHPTRENSAVHQSGGRGGGAPVRSPDVSSRSPPNLMAGPSGEATGDLLHTPNTHCNNHSSSSSNSSSDTSAVAQQQQQQLVHLPHLLPLNTSVQSPLAVHHQQQMGSVPHQLGLQQQQQLHLPTGSPGQSTVHSTTSPMLPPVASHMSCPSSSHHTSHMTSPQGTVHPVRMISPTAMGGTTMPHQQYPNALPPHVTTTTNPPAVLLESIKVVTPIQLTTIGNEQSDQQQQQHMLPSFGTIEQSLLPSFTHLSISTRYVVEQNQLQPINVGGLSAEDIVPQESFESSASNYNDPFSPSRYKLFINGEATSSMETQTNENSANAEYPLVQQCEQNMFYEDNNNLVKQAKEDIDPNVSRARSKKGRKSKASLSKQRQVTITNGANFISENDVHKCIDCSKFFMKGCYLTQHIKTFHSGEKPFKCAQCGKRFPSEEVHGKHVQMHTLARRHKCDVCPKIFAHKTDLKRHSCVHTGKRPFKCDICSKGFIRHDHMKKHQLTHNKKNADRRLRLDLAAQKQRQRTQRQQQFNTNRENFIAIENGVQQFHIYVKSENKSP